MSGLSPEVVGFLFFEQLPHGGFKEIMLPFAGTRDGPQPRGRTAKKKARSARLAPS